ncbi:MAG TPA: hypothetical protein ENI60_02525 [Candidatus Fraserbacteria bacterium]|nr:hypothetical protein [Candidatus Fraserbacteria bacterium]
MRRSSSRRYSADIQAACRISFSRRSGATPPSVSGRGFRAALILLLAALALLAPSARADEGGLFNIGGGPVYLGALLNLSDLAASLQGIRFPGDLTLGGRKVFLMQGVAGLVGSRLRFGGLGAEGHWTLPLQTNAEFDQASLSLHYSGLLLEQLAAVSRTAQMGLWLGTIVGRGDWALRLSKTPQGDFSSLVSRPLTVQLRRSFVFALPYFSMEFKFLSFAGLRVGGGWLITFSLDDWRLPGGQIVGGGPLQSLSAPVFQLMIIIGG